MNLSAGKYVRVHCLVVDNGKVIFNSKFSYKKLKFKDYRKFIHHYKKRK